MRNHNICNYIIIYNNKIISSAHYKATFYHFLNQVTALLSQPSYLFGNNFCFEKVFFSFFSLQGHQGQRGPPGPLGAPGKDVSHKNLCQKLHFLH